MTSNWGWKRVFASPKPSIFNRIRGQSQSSELVVSPSLHNRHVISEEIDGRAALEAFKSHWAQAWSVMQKKCVPSLDPITVDDITSVVNHVEHMVTLLVQESEGVMSPESDSHSPIMMGPLLDYLLMEQILDKLLSWSTHAGEWSYIMKLEQLKLYELLVSQLCHREVLFQQPLIRPLLSLLAQCFHRLCPLEVEKRLVVLLNTLFVCISQNINLLELFFLDEPFVPNHRESRFLIFALLIPYLHLEGAIGQQARDALLVCMAISRQNDKLAHFIVDNSNFCPVLATGLSGLYSSLPRKLINEAQPKLPDDWHRLTTEDIQEFPELQMFLNSLEFCNAVVQISHPMIQQQLLDYVYNGFLVLVMGPALHQDIVDMPLSQLEKMPKYSNTLEEIIAATAYLEMFVRTITEPILLQVFLKFLFTEKFEEHKILDTLILRINAHSKLSLVTLVLFRTLLDLNCEDVLLELVFKYFDKCQHLIGNDEQKLNRINDTSCFNISAQKFLTLIPLCCVNASGCASSCMERNASYDSSYVWVESEELGLHSHASNGNANYGNASNGNASNGNASYGNASYGNASYGNASAADRENQSIEANGNNDSSLQQHIDYNYLEYLNDAHCNLLSCRNATNSWNNKYDSINSMKQSQNHFDRPGESANESSSLDSFSSSDKNANIKVPTNGMDHDVRLPMGSFLNALFSRLDSLCENDLFTNLQLTGIISRLAQFPQPLLRSFLLSSKLSYQNDIKSLWIILADLRNKLDISAGQIACFDVMFAKARRYMNAREERFMAEQMRYLNESKLQRSDSMSSMVSVSSEFNSPSLPKDPVRKRTRSLRDFFMGRSSNTNSPVVQTPAVIEPAENGQGYRYVNKRFANNNANTEPALEACEYEEIDRVQKIVLAALVFEEFLKEISAITYEHYILEKYFDSQC